MKLPSNVRPPHAYPFHEWDPLDPGYDVPGPIRRDELSWQLVAEAVVVFVAICLIAFLASLTAVGQ